MPARASGDHGVVGEPFVPALRVRLVGDQRVGAPVLGREQHHRAQPVARRDARAARAREVERVDAEVLEHVDGRLAVGARDVLEAAGRLVPARDRVEVDRAAVLEERRRADVELVARRVAAEVGQRVEQQDPRVLAEAVAVVLGGREPARAGADDHAVVGLVAVADVADVDARAAARRVHVALIRRAVDPHDVADEVVLLALESGLGRRVIARRQRARAVTPRRGERLGAAQVRGGRCGGEPGCRDRHAVEEVTAGDPVALVAELGHLAPSPGLCRRPGNPLRRDRPSQLTTG